ncbi:23.6 kDa heat shock protein, mitochondrial isoform X1 [Eucalyptus grandis]|uniref:23.6 kDa heat shock protein, mitochondrial isoform X1 n=1 Tax=Eucalyptus grandis TaxID=71139 RepID=UPI00192EBC26|nr:23.6 kDa heat shock protein, mitochondrial isoform X1 [Eucalyptus grandis]
MASPLALRRALASAISSNKLSIPVRSATVALTRSFNTETQMTRVDDGSKAVDVDQTPDCSVSRRRDRSLAPFSDSDAFDPFFPTRSLSQVLNLMDQLMEDPFQASSGFGGGSRRAWDVKEDDKALRLRIDMPGLSKEDVKLAVEQNTLIIRGEGGEPEGGGDEEGARRYSSRIDLPLDLYKLEEIKAEMKNGVLKVVVPKLQEAERKDAMEVPVE